MKKSSRLKELLVGTGIYGIGTFGQKILMFLMVPLYTYYLQTSEMGVYDIIISATSILIPIITLQISDAVYRWLIRENVEVKAFLRVTYVFLFISSCIVLMILAVVNALVNIPYFYYFIGVLFSSVLFQTCQKIVRGLGRQWLFALSGIVYTIVFLALNIIQLVAFKMGVEALFVSFILANVVGTITIFILENKMRVNVFKKVDFSTLKDLLQYSVPLIPNYLSWWIVDMSDKYVVLWFLGLEFNGVLAIVYKFPAILQSIYSVFLNSWQDFSVSTMEAIGDFSSSVFKVLYRISFMGLWAIIPITKVFVWLSMADDYKVACDYIPFYYLGAIFQAFCSFYGVGYLRSKKTKGAFYSSVYGAVVNIIINVILIKFIGLHAAAISTFVSFLVMWLVRVKHNKEELNIMINWKEFIVLVTLDVFVSLISIKVGIEVNVLIALVGVVLFMIFNLNNIKMLVGAFKKK